MPEPAYPPAPEATAKHEDLDRPSVSSGHPTVEAVAPPDLAELARRHAALRARFLEVVGQMKQTSAGMCESGRPPEFWLVQALGDCHRRFVRLRHDVLQRAATRNRKVRSTERLATLSDLEAFLETLVEPDPPARVAPLETQTHNPDTSGIVAPLVAESTTEPLASEPIMPEAAHVAPATEPASPPDEPPSAAETDHLEPVAESASPLPDDEPMRAAALDLLEKALRLSLTDGTDLPALTEFHDRAQALRETITSSPPGALPPEAGSLAAGLHPLARLANAVEGREELSDADWADVHVMVTETFGRPLAVALARQRLIVRPVEG